MHEPCSVHYGDAIEPPGRLGWHADAPNSLIHMAIALRGRRALHSKLCAAAGAEREHLVEWQEPGDVYVTSPTCFEHAVEYPACNHRDRVIAVQARLLVDEEELYSGFESFNQEQDCCELMEILGPAISSISTEMPSLQAVEAMVAAMAGAGEACSHAPPEPIAEGSLDGGHQGVYLAGYASDGGRGYSTLTLAMMACMADPTAGGVTREEEGYFTVRAGTQLEPSPSGEISWLKSEAQN